MNKIIIVIVKIIMMMMMERQLNKIFPTPDPKYPKEVIYSWLQNHIFDFYVLKKLPSEFSQRTTVSHTADSQ